MWGKHINYAGLYEKKIKMKQWKQSTVSLNILIQNGKAVDGKFNCINWVWICFCLSHIWTYNTFGGKNSKEHTCSKNIYSILLNHYKIINNAVLISWLFHPHLHCMHFLVPEIYFEICFVIWSLKLKCSILYIYLELYGLQHIFVIIKKLYGNDQTTSAKPDKAKTRKPTWSVYFKSLILQ